VVDAEVLEATESLLSLLAEAGADVVDVELPHAALAKEANTLTMVCEAFAYHRMDMGSDRWTEYGSGTRRIIARGALYSAADYVQAQRFRRWFCREVAEVMSGVDLLVTPTWPSSAQRTDEMDIEKRILLPSFTGPFNLLGYPALALPIGFGANGMPLSGQIVAAPFAESLTLRAGHAYQERTSWHLAVPSIVDEHLAAAT
ncbi:MAG: amidase family protein, partial [Actinomycetota bacterium]